MLLTKRCECLFTFYMNYGSNALYIIRLILWNVCMRLVVGFFLCVALCGCSDGARISQGKWTKAEDAILLTQVTACGEDWVNVAAAFAGKRNARQCRDRWICYHNAPPLWPEEDYQLLLTLHDQLGEQWSWIAERLGRKEKEVIQYHLLQRISNPIFPESVTT
jgi:hypothetical protein